EARRASIASTFRRDARPPRTVSASPHRRNLVAAERRDPRHLRALLPSARPLLWSCTREVRNTHGRWHMRTGLISTVLAAACSLGISIAPDADAAGTLTPKGSTGPAPTLIDHQVHVVLNNGFARTEVTQRFGNPSGAALDATYEFPVPKDAA